MRSVNLMRAGVITVAGTVVLVSCVCPAIRAADGREISKSRSSVSATALGATATDGDEDQARALVRRQRADGTRLTQVIEDDKMIRITERPAHGITVIVVESLGDKDKVNRYSAPNLAGLKAKHARAYELYKKYATGDDVAEGVMRPTDEGMNPLVRERGKADMRHGTAAGQPRRGGFPPNFGRDFGSPHQSGFSHGQVYRQSGAFRRGSASASASASARASASSRSSSRSSSSSSSHGRQQMMRRGTGSRQ